MWVVNSSIIKWHPVDRVAARVVLPVPWYCHAPDVEDVEQIKSELLKLVEKERVFDAQRARRDERAKAKGAFTSISDAEIESVANKRKKLAFQIEQLCNMLTQNQR